MVIGTCTSLNNIIINFMDRVVFPSSGCVLFMQLLCLTEMLQMIPKPLHVE